MKHIAIILLATWTSTNAASLRGNSNDTTETAFKNALYNEKNIVYRGQHEIVDVYLPLFLTFEHGNAPHRMLFFVEADRNEDGSKTDKGLYSIIDDDTKKLLDYGRDIDGDSLGNVYFAADDGVYTYDSKENKAIKYGSLNDSIISVAAENNTGVIHALSQNHVLYSIKRNGLKADINDRVKNALDIEISIADDSLYYYDINKNAYVLNKDGITNKIIGFPENPSYIKMIKGPVVMDSMFFIVNDDIYQAFPNGTSALIPNEENNILIQLYKPTAFSLEAGIVFYYAREQKIYEFNLITQILSGILRKFAEKFRN